MPTARVASTRCKHRRRHGDCPACRDVCVVPSEPLAVLLHDFARAWTRTRPTTSGQFAPGRQRATQRRTLSAVEYLALETRRAAARHGGRGVPQSTIENLLARGPDGRPRPRSAVTELRIADPLVAAVGMEVAFHDGTLPIGPNPNASRAAQRACCSGSLTG